jgi:hypothetical protein
MRGYGYAFYAFYALEFIFLNFGRLNANALPLEITENKSQRIERVERIEILLITSVGWRSQLTKKLSLSLSLSPSLSR